ncbi:MAG: chemotaxis protein CheW [Rickettsiales bacterium]
MKGIGATKGERRGESAHGGDGARDVYQFLTFSVAGASYGVNIMAVREIIGWTQTTRLPNSPAYMKGVINLRGAIIPIFDLKCRFRLGSTDPNEKNVVVIMSVADKLIGVLADTVSDILHCSEDDVRPAPQLEGAKAREEDEYIDGLISLGENEMTMLLNVERIFSEEKVRAIAEQAEKIRDDVRAA